MSNINLQDESTITSWMNESCDHDRSQKRNTCPKCLHDLVLNERKMVHQVCIEPVEMMSDELHERCDEDSEDDPVEDSVFVERDVIDSLLEVVQGVNITY